MATPGRFEESPPDESRASVGPLAGARDDPLDDHRGPQDDHRDLREADHHDRVFQVPYGRGRKPRSQEAKKPRNPPGAAAVGDWHDRLPDRVRITVAGVESADCAGAAELDGDYILDLVDRQPDSCRWEVSFPSKCRLFRMGLIASPKPGGGIDLCAILEGSLPGPAWVAQGLHDLGGFTQLRFDRIATSNPSAGCLWPGTVALTPISSTVTGSTPTDPRSGMSPRTNTTGVGPHDISPEPTTRQMAEMAALASISSGGCQLMGIIAASLTACVDTNNTYSASGTNLSTVGWTTNPVGNPPTGTGLTFVTSWAATGSKVVTATCGMTSYSVNINVVKLTFSSTSLKTGFTISPVDNKVLPIRVPATLTCDPPTQVANVTLTVIGTNRVVIANKRIDSTTGVLSFTVGGTSPTPSSTKAGDASILAQIDGNTCAAMQAIVIVPASIQQPFPQASGNVRPQNLRLNVTTTPPFPSVDKFNVALVTVWLFPLTITVLDQFGNVLDDIYIGAPVYEKGANDLFFNINVRIVSGGTYTDLVGVVEVNSIVPAGSDPAILWPSQGPLQMTFPGENQTIPVSVGGNSIGTIRRTTIATPPNNVQIIWPPQ